MRSTNDSATCSGIATAYIKLLLFFYAAAAPHLLVHSGASSDPKYSSALSALGCVAIAFGVGILLYEGTGSHGQGALGLLVAVSGLITVVVIMGAPKPPAAAPRPTGQHQVFFKSQQTHGAPEQPPHGAPEQPPLGAPVTPPQGAPGQPPLGAPEQPPQGLLQEVSPPEYSEVLEAMAIEPDGRARGGAVGGTALSTSDEPNAADLERLFNAPTINEFLVPSPGGFVTPSQTDAIQSNSPGGSDMSSAVIMTLGAGSYSAQGATAVADVMGVP